MKREVTLNIKIALMLIATMTIMSGVTVVASLPLISQTLVIFLTLTFSLN
jgi:hypothetical protein